MLANPLSSHLSRFIQIVRDQIQIWMETVKSNGNFQASSFSFSFSFNSHFISCTRVSLSFWEVFFLAHSFAVGSDHSSDVQRLTDDGPCCLADVFIAGGHQIKRLILKDNDGKGGGQPNQVVPGHPSKPKCYSPRHPSKSKWCPHVSFQIKELFPYILPNQIVVTMLPSKTKSYPRASFQIKELVPESNKRLKAIEPPWSVAARDFLGEGQAAGTTPALLLATK